MIAGANVSFETRNIEVPPRGGSISALELGMAWFPEQPGGMDRYYFDLMKRLAAANVDANGLVCASPAVDRETGGRVHAACVSNTKMPARLLAIRRAAKRMMSEIKPDLIAAHFALYAWPVLDSLKRKPFVMHFHGPWAAECRMEGAGRMSCWAKYRLERSVYQSAGRLITLSEVFRDLLIRDYAVDPSRITVIPGGVDLSRFNVSASRSEARARLNWPQDRPIVLTVRRLKKRMGLENLLDAASVVRQKHPQALILIAGAGDLSKQLQQRIDDGGLKETVRLIGFLPDADLPLAYRAADLSIVPSIALEGFGLVAVESMAAGTPAIVTPVGGLPEIVRPFCRDLVTRDVTPEALAESMIQALGNLASLPGGKLCKEYADRYDWPEVTRLIRGVYSSVIS